MSELPEVSTLFSKFEFDAGNIGAARVRFQMLVTDLVAVQHPTASEVAGPGGTDWGIDTYVGSLANEIVVWQSKFFPRWNDGEPQGQVRKSFNDLMNKAKANDLTVIAWTLCVPCVLHPAQQKWFDTWAKGKMRDHNLAIELWNGTALRRRLMHLEASHLADAYFGSGTAPISATVLETEALAHLTDPTTYDDALFVRQLEEAGHNSNNAARGYFFAADALARDIAARAHPASVDALHELDLEVQGVWDEHFNRLVGTADGTGRIEGLVETVINSAGKLSDPEGLRLRPPHRKGFVHRLVEDRRAGWVSHWRDIAAAAQPAVSIPTASMAAE